MVFRRIELSVGCVILLYIIVSIVHSIDLLMQISCTSITPQNPSCSQLCVTSLVCLWCCCTSLPLRLTRSITIEQISQKIRILLIIILIIFSRKWRAKMEWYCVDWRLLLIYLLIMYFLYLFSLDTFLQCSLPTMSTALFMAAIGISWKLCLANSKFNCY
jgi:hypothetical protein